MLEMSQRSRALTQLIAIVFLACSTVVHCQSNGPIRLWRSGYTSLSYTSGRVQVVLNGQWGNICDDASFGLTEATVICHQLGYTGASNYSRTSSDSFGIDIRPTVLSSVDCSTSSYLVILQCSYDSTPPSSCTDSDDVSVTCFSTRIWDNPYNGQIRLTGGTTVNQGLVEVYCSGQWGTVCDDSFGQNDADTICRQLGYYSAFDYDHLSIRGSFSQPILLDDVQCSSPKPCIGDCVGSCPVAHNCGHSEDITISCYSPGHCNGTTENTCVNKFPDGPASLTIGTCLNELKIEGHTGNLANARSSSSHKIQLNLKDGTNLQGTLCHSTRNTPYLCTLFFKTGLKASSKCVKMEDIINVSLIANGNDGWYIASISAYVKTTYSQYMLLTKNDNFNKWLDGNQHYPYDAKKHALTFVTFCLNELKIQGRTGNLGNAGSSSQHKIQLGLKDGTNLQGTLCHFARNKPYLYTLSFPTGLNAGNKCVQMEDVQKVSLIANGNDGWYIASISAYVKTSSSQYMLLTKNDNFNKWLDGNQHYQKHVLTFVAFCLNELKIQGQTGNLVSAGSSSPHKIQLNLKDGTHFQVTLCHFTQNTTYLCTLFFKTGLNAGSKCVQMEDINQVSLIAKGNDGWYIASISAYVKTSSFRYMLLTKNDNFNKWLDGNQHYPYNAKKHVLTFVAFCLNELKIQGQTRNLVSAGSSSPHKIQLNLKDGTNLQGTLCHSTQNTLYLCTLFFKAGLNAGSKCVQMEDINQVSLIANGNDGWYIASISAYVKTSSFQYMLLTKNDNFNKWLDRNQHLIYPYNAKKHVLTFVAFCLNELKIQGQTGNLGNAESSSPHKIQLGLKDGTNLQGTLCHFARNKPYLYTLSFPTGLNAGNKCVQMEDVQKVSLIANGNDGWYIASISAYVKTSSSQYMLLTKNDNFNKWLDGNQHYPYNAKKHVLTFVAFCLIELKIQGQTRNLVSTGSSSPHKIQLNLKDGTNLQGTLCHSTQNTPYLCTLFFKTGLNAGSKCVQMEDINQVSLIANGNDGWYIASISAYVKTCSFRYMLLTKNDNFNKWLDGNQHYPYNAKKHVLTFVAFCLIELKIQGQTRNLVSAGSSSPHKIQLNLKDGTNLQGTLCHSTQNTPYLCTLFFKTGLNAGSKCVQMEDINQVSLIANGNDGWYIASISAYVKTSSFRYMLLTMNDNFNKWLDGNEHLIYPYNAKKHVLIFCLNELKIQGQTGNLGNAGSSSPHKIQLGLKNGTSLLGTLCHFARNKQYLYTLSFATGLNAGNKCVQMEDIQKVSLIANGNDGWYIASISIYVKTNNSQYRLLIKNENFHRWLDGNDHYPYDAKKHSLTFAAEIRIQAATLVATGNDEDDA